MSTGICRLPSIWTDKVSSRTQLVDAYALNGVLCEIRRLIFIFFQLEYYLREMRAALTKYT